MAFALFAPLAYAADDSSGIQYRDAPPTVTGKTSNVPSGDSSAADGSGGSGKSSTSGGSSGGRSGDGDSGSGGAAGKGGNGGNGKGGAGGGKSGVGGGKPLGHGAAAVSGGGDSPLVPILIALAALAAISIGAVLLRRRGGDSDSGSSVSPEAG